MRLFAELIRMGSPSVNHTQAFAYFYHLQCISPYRRPYMQVEAHLQYPRESLQIPYPQGFKSNDKTHADDAEIIVGYEPRYYSAAELPVIEAYLPQLPYNQSLIRTGAILIGDDALLAATHDDLDRIETAAQLTNSRYVDEATERPLRDRVYLARELGYRGGILAAPAVEAPAPAAKADIKTSSKKEAVSA